MLFVIPPVRYLRSLKEIKVFLGGCNNLNLPIKHKGLSEINREEEIET